MTPFLPTLVAVPLWAKLVSGTDLAIAAVHNLVTAAGIKIGHRRMLTHRPFQTFSPSTLMVKAVERVGLA